MTRRTRQLCSILVCASVWLLVYIQGISAQALNNFTKIEGAALFGHDDAGIFALAHESVEDEEGCAQACLNDRSCNSFEFGVSGDTEGDCRLSYDTQSTINASAQVQESVTGIAEQNGTTATPLWDYYELTIPVNSLVGFAAPLADTWLPGVNDVATHANVTRQACAAMCLHNAACRSFEFSTHGAECNDR